MNIFYGFLIPITILLIPAGLMWCMNKETPKRKNER